MWRLSAQLPASPCHILSLTPSMEQMYFCIHPQCIGLPTLNFMRKLLSCYQSPPLPRAVSKCCSSVKQLGNSCRALKGGSNKLCQVCVQTGCKFYVCAACSIGNMMHFHQMKMIIVHVVVYYIWTHLVFVDFFNFAYLLLMLCIVVFVFFCQDENWKGSS